MSLGDFRGFFISPLVRICNSYLSCRLKNISQLQLLHSSELHTECNSARARVVTCYFKYIIPPFSLESFPSVGKNKVTAYLLLSVSIIEGFANEAEPLGVEIKTSV